MTTVLLVPGHQTRVDDLQGLEFEHAWIRDEPGNAELIAALQTGPTRECVTTFSSAGYDGRTASFGGIVEMIEVHHGDAGPWMLLVLIPPNTAALDWVEHLQSMGYVVSGSETRIVRALLEG